MTEEIAHNIYRIGVPLTGNPLKELNSYLIKGKDRDLLIDTGFRNPECFDVLTGELKKLGSDISRRNVLLTHMHSDHSGLADLAAGAGRKIFISEKDRSYMVKTRAYFCIQRKPAIFSVNATFSGCRLYI